MLYIYKSRGFIKKVVQVNVQGNKISQRMRQESSFQDEQFSFNEGKMQFFAKNCIFSKLQPHCGTDYHYPIKMKLCLNVANLIQLKNLQSDLCRKRAPSWSKWEKIEKCASFGVIRGGGGLLDFRLEPKRLVR